MKGRWVGGWFSVWAALLLVTALGGCSTKEPEEPLEGLPGRGGMNESDLGGAEGGRTRGSLAEARGVDRSVQGPLDDIHFDYDSFDLDEPARSTLRGHAQWLESHSGAALEIEGHCDERGTIEYNLALGSKRAAAVKDYLVALGVGASRISTISYGEELPLCREPSESCLQRNRRAHFVVLGE